jgi:hypothetical protein
LCKFRKTVLLSELNTAPTLFTVGKAAKESAKALSIVYSIGIKKTILLLIASAFL